MDASPRLAAALVALGAFLLFLVEPLIARRLLPAFGGTAAVWTTCLLCFQALLVGGYAAAHGLSRLPPGRRRAAQWAALALAVLALLAAPPPDFGARVTDSPTLGVLLAVLTAVGLPFLVLATTGPNVARILGGAPYRLYALSNAASLAALLVYPTLIEPAFTLSTQATLFMGGFGLYALLGAALVARDGAALAAPPTLDDSPPPRPWLRWLALSAVPSGLFMTVTNHLGTNIAPMPLLWVLPLALYLITLILCFDHPRWYRRAWFVGLLPVSLVFLGLLRTNMFVHGSLIVQVAGVCGALFMASMALHGELARLRPGPEGVTAFYLTLALGGALGGVFVAVLAPALLVTPLEFPLLLLGTAVAVGVSWRMDPPEDWRVAKVAGAFLWLFVGLFVVLTAGLEVQQARAALTQVRGPYGALRVSDLGTGDNAIRSLINGTIRHGAHWTDPARRHTPSTYYSATSGVGRAVTALRTRGPVHMGVVGLGAGSLADWLRAEDRGVFYELNPQVEDIARQWFFALPEAKAPIEVVIGDARRRLSEESPRGYDLLVVDAFNSDAVPTHLLTRECFELYRRHLAPGGLLAVHISNRFVSLEPVLGAEAHAGGWAGRVIFDHVDDVDVMHFASKWVLMSEKAETLAAHPELTEGAPLGEDALPAPWTDDYAPLWGLFEWR